MIHSYHISEWGEVVLWSQRRQVAQDLIINRVIVVIFSDDFLRKMVRIRGGTALNKMHFPFPYRYSEDIDLVLVFEGPLGPILERLRAVLEPLLGRAKYGRSQIAPKLLFRVQAEKGGELLRLKVEINNQEMIAFDTPVSLPFAVSNGWFSGEAVVSAFSLEEKLATKLLALFQRNKSRDLFDLTHALETFPNLDVGRIVQISGEYLALRDSKISRAQTQDRMFAKLADKEFLSDILPLLPQAAREGLTEEVKRESIRLVLAEFVELLPGKPWKSLPAMQEQFGISW